jgi:catabolite regulation protein CreA
MNYYEIFFKNSDVLCNNYCNTIMTTNNDFTIPISQTDRRNVFFKASDTHKQDEVYFKKLASTFKKQDVARAFYEYSFIMTGLGFKSSCTLLISY